MEFILSSAVKEQLLSSFHQIATGETIDSAYQYLEAKRWNLEDAIDLFYAGFEGEVSNSSSSHHTRVVLPNICLNPSSSSAALFTSSDIITPTEVSLVSSCPALASLPDVNQEPDLLKRRRRRTRAEIPADNANQVTVPKSPEFVQVRRKQISVELAAPIAVSPPEFVQRRRRRTRCEIAADAAGGNKIPTSPEFITCRRKRTFTEMARDASTVTADSISSPSTESIGRRHRRTRAEMVAAVEEGSLGYLSCGSHSSAYQVSIDVSTVATTSFTPTVIPVATTIPQRKSQAKGNGVLSVRNPPRERRARLEVLRFIFIAIRIILSLEYFFSIKKPYICFIY